jgi:hypothetical protein
MTEDIKNVEQNQDSVKSDEIDISALFKKHRDNLKPIKNVPTSKETKEEKQETLSLNDKHEPNSYEEVKEKKEIKEEKQEEKKVVPGGSDEWKLEKEKIQKDLRETQKWANDMKKQISSYKKAIEKFKEEGILSDDESVELLDHTKYEEIIEKDKPFLFRASQVWDKEIPNIRKYTDLDDIDKHIEAFQHFLANATRKEIEKLENDWGGLMESNPVEFTKKMLGAAKEYCEEVYEDFLKVGSLKGFKTKYESRFKEKEVEYEELLKQKDVEYEELLKQKDKTIDKLQKEVVKYKSQYEDYNEPNYNIPQGGGNSGGKEAVNYRSPGKLIDMYNQGKYRL